jgi:transposase
VILSTFDGHSDKRIQHLSEMSLKDAAKRLGVLEALLYFWCSRTRLREEKSKAETRLLVESARLKRQSAERAEELEILKNRGIFRKGSEVRDASIDAHADRFRIRTVYGPFAACSKSPGAAHMPGKPGGKHPQERKGRRRHLQPRTTVILPVTVPSGTRIPKLSR